ncbi:MAG: SDR family NAD(P)-dependent oxidoreductase [Neisseria sp.]|nr:SDR family NAD(P)-dependent oxidoreductase [Neisseria sp.]
MDSKNLFVITGHSSGLGKALAEHYLAAGAGVIGISRRKWPSEQANTQELHEYIVDLADAQAVSSLLGNPDFQTRCKTAARLVLINNAGTLAPSRLAGRSGWQETAQAVALNIAAPLMLADAFITWQQECAASGISDGLQTLDIVHISSGAGRKAYPAWSVYGACKAALDQHARVIAAEAHPKVRIVSLAPGVVDTQMQQQIRAGNADDFPLLETFRKLHSEGQLASAQQTAEKIAAFIVSPDFGSETVFDIRNFAAE